MPLGYRKLNEEKAHIHIPTYILNLTLTEQHSYLPAGAPREWDVDEVAAGEVEIKADCCRGAIEVDGCWVRVEVDGWVGVEVELDGCAGVEIEVNGWVGRGRGRD